MKKIKLGIFGPEGRMGADLLVQQKNFKDLELSSLCERKGHPSIGKIINGKKILDNVEQFVSLSDVIIDFTVPEATIELMRVMKNYKKVSLVTGTTGYNKNSEKIFLNLSKGKKILRSFNMSIGINLLKNLAGISSKSIGELADIEITEIHHNKKKDIPSGTALVLVDSIKKGCKKIKKYTYRKDGPNNPRKTNEIGLTSIRGGDIIGEHRVYFFLDGERIELSHKASDRKIFSNGALEAARWINNKKPGLYSIKDMLD